MKLRELSIENIHIPFKVSFQHSSTSRNATEAILVTATTINDLQGYGEGCPRQYVTGETVQTAHDFFNKHYLDFLKISTLDDLKLWMSSHQKVIDKNPAAFCAVELALLEVLAKQLDKSVESFLSLPELFGEFQYTAVLGTRNPDSFKKQLKQYLDLGFKNFKIKVFAETEIDQANIDEIKRFSGDNLRVRLDANNLWTNWQTAASYIEGLDYPFSGLEEPLSRGEYVECRELFRRLEIPIILDESFVTIADFEFLKTNFKPWIVNIRISKMGGILRSLMIAEQCNLLGIPIIIGAQVGETSILSRAALTVANKYRHILLAQEGAFGTYLLQHDIVDKPIMFGKKGILEAWNI